MREKLEITEEEKHLCNYSSKTCTYEKFKEYVEIENKINKNKAKNMKIKYFDNINDIVI